MEVCVVSNYYRRARYCWEQTLKALSMQYILENEKYFKCYTHPLRIHFNSLVVYFVTDYKYYQWSKGRHDIKVMTGCEYIKLLDVLVFRKGFTTVVK